MFDTLTGNVLGDPGPAGIDGLNLSIGFTKNLSAATLDFATADFGTPSPLTLTAYENANLVGSATASGIVPNGFTFPEGQVSFAGKSFNRLVVSSPAMDFAVDNISVNVVTTPEPAAFWLFAVGLLSIALPAIRRSFTAAAK
jgi:hypothetical protein